MSEFTYPLDGTMNYSAAQAGAFNGTRTSGVWSGDDNLSVSVADATRLRLSKGLAWFTTDLYWGKVYCNTEELFFVPPAADVALDRIFRIIIRWNKTANSTNAMLVAGALSSSPTPPERNNSNEVFDLVVAEYYQTHGEAQLDPMKLTDTRLDESLCGLMRDGVTRLPSDVLYAQYREALEQLRRAISEAWAGVIPENSISFDMLETSARSLAFENIVVPDWAWEETGIGSYPFRAPVELPGSGVTDTYFAEIVFDEDTLQVAELAKHCESYEGGFYIFAAAWPEQLVKISTAKCTPTEPLALASEVFGTISVNYAAGAEVTCSDGVTTLRAKTTSGRWEFAIPYAGTWTVSDGENSETVSITTQGQTKRVDLSPISADLILYKSGVNNGLTNTGYTKGGGFSSFSVVDAVFGNENIEMAPGKNTAVSYIGSSKSIDLSDYEKLIIYGKNTVGNDTNGKPQAWYGITASKQILPENWDLGGDRIAESSSSTTLVELSLSVSSPAYLTVGAWNRTGGLSIEEIRLVKKVR